MRKHFYHQTTRSYIVAFASLFDSIFCNTGGGELTPVPLHYAPKQKFLAILDEDMDKDGTDVETTLPRIANFLNSWSISTLRRLGHWSSGYAKQHEQSRNRDHREGRGKQN